MGRGRMSSLPKTRYNVTLSPVSTSKARAKGSPINTSRGPWVVASGRRPRSNPPSMRSSTEVLSTPRTTTPCRAWGDSRMPARSWRRATWATPGSRRRLSSMPGVHTKPSADGSLGATWMWLSNPTINCLTSCWKPCTMAEAKIMSATPNATPAAAMRTTGLAPRWRLLRAMRLAKILSTLTT